MKKVRRNRQIVVHRPGQVLTLWSRRPLGPWTRVKNYNISTGVAGLETPAGRYEIINGSRCPEYQYPDSDWVPPELRGVRFPCGAKDNPIVDRWLGLGGDEDIANIGIHGTRTVELIGEQASHGCIRMKGEAVCDLYDRVGLQTTVLIV
jgi:lipoprotein-anchoring transpeptidase ErfK/SrfK